ncbi:hypothetical protein GCM10008967_35110 [Bacillus carboniphilus]|uniref:Uncharacterized protein n=1 Tax=Bacillus carboniphilus TaxID=86663 RepID=A0ABN0WM73_9BACI
MNSEVSARNSELSQVNSEVPARNSELSQVNSELEVIPTIEKFSTRKGLKVSFFDKSSMLDVSI